MKQRNSILGRVELSIFLTQCNTDISLTSWKWYFASIHLKTDSNSMRHDHIDEVKLLQHMNKKKKKKKKKEDGKQRNNIIIR